MKYQISAVCLLLSFFALNAACAEEAAKGEETKVDTHAFTLPAAWKKVPPANSMRAYQAAITKAEGDAEDAEFVVSKSGGGLDANIKRWASQFGGDGALKKKSELKTADGTTATFVEIEGEYSAMTMQGPQPPKAGYAQLGAIISTADGDFFLKLVGPKKTVDANKAAFQALVGSFK